MCVVGKRGRVRVEGGGGVVALAYGFFVKYGLRHCC